ncbi:MAG: hypothetical protein LC107_13490, partial [Chitinophagales bacterium]|nr:hypothetical protein [Chitinophagales bacterium]
MKTPKNSFLKILYFFTLIAFCPFANGQNAIVILNEDFNLSSKEVDHRQWCYKIQLKNGSLIPINLAGQNYRLYYDSELTKLDESSITSYLPKGYTSLALVQHAYNMDASGFGKLAYENHLGFINLATDYNLTLGHPLVIGIGETIDIGRLCFDSGDEIPSPELTWANEDLTNTYATAFVELAQVSGKRLKQLKIDDYIINHHNTTSTDRKQLLTFDFFPNPFTEQLDINLGHALDSDGTLEVLDVFGRLLHTATLEKGTDHVTLKGDKFPDGAL